VIHVSGSIRQTTARVLSLPAVAAAQTGHTHKDVVHVVNDVSVVTERGRNANATVVGSMRGDVTSSWLEIASRGGRSTSVAAAVVAGTESLQATTAWSWPPANETGDVCGLLRLREHMHDGWVPDRHGRRTWTSSSSAHTGGRCAMRRPVGWADLDASGRTSTKASARSASSSMVVGSRDTLSCRHRGHACAGMRILPCAVRGGHDQYDARYTRERERWEPT
jgi:hypothetical protein